MAALEDAGFYCVDNMPVALLPKFLQLPIESDTEIAGIALVMDLREKGFLTKYSKIFKSLKKKDSPQTKQLHLFDNYIEKLSEKLNTDVQIKHRKNQLTISVSYGRFKDYIDFLDQLCTIEISPFES